MVDRVYSRNRELDVLYLHLCADEPTESVTTIEVGHSVLIDINQNGDVYGIGCLDTESPFAKFIREAVGDSED